LPKAARRSDWLGRFEVRWFGWLRLGMGGEPEADGGKECSMGFHCDIVSERTARARPTGTPNSHGHGHGCYACAVNCCALHLWRFLPSQGLDANEHLDIQIAVPRRHWLDFHAALEALGRNGVQRLDMAVMPMPRKQPHHIDNANEVFAPGVANFTGLRLQACVGKRATLRLHIKPQGHITLETGQLGWARLGALLARAQQSPAIYEHLLPIEHLAGHTGPRPASLVMWGIDDREHVVYL
jgi:hypothetical protein